MSAIGSTRRDAEAKDAPTSGRLFFLDLGAGRILSANPDGSDLKTIINEGRKLPNGLVLDVAAGRIYWTNMGDPKRNDGSIMRSCKNMITIVPPGGHVHAKAAPTGEEERQARFLWRGEIRQPRMYQLIRQHGPIKDSLFEIEFLDPGVEAFSFTFG